MLLALLATLALADASPRYFTRECGRTPGGRSTRGVPCAPSFAYFEFAPANGAGMGAACAGTTPTAASGQAINGATRASVAYCTKEGVATTGLTTTSMVQLSANQVRVEAVGTALFVRTEPAVTNIDLRSEEFEDGAWTSTAGVAANTTLSPWNALTADTLTDASGAAIQSSCQTIATTSAVKFTFSAYLTAGTLAKASVRITGTGSSTGDCVASTASLASTYTRLGCSSPAAYAGTLTALTVCVEVGTVVGDTGSIVVIGAQTEATDYMSSYIPTTSAAATRALDIVTTSAVNLAPVVSSGCAAMTVLPLSTTVDLSMLVGGGSARYLYLAAPTIRSFDGTNNPTLSAGLVAGTPKRYRATWSASTLAIFNTTDATTASGSFDGTMTGDGTLRFAENGIIGVGPALWGLVQLDPSPTRCQ